MINFFIIRQPGFCCYCFLQFMILVPRASSLLLKWLKSSLYELKVNFKLIISLHFDSSQLWGHLIPSKNCCHCLEFSSTIRALQSLLMWSKSGAHLVGCDSGIEFWGPGGRSGVAYPWDEASGGLGVACCVPGLVHGALRSQGGGSPRRAGTGNCLGWEVGQPRFMCSWHLIKLLTLSKFPGHLWEKKTRPREVQTTAFA